PERLCQPRVIRGPAWGAGVTESCAVPDSWFGRNSCGEPRTMRPSRQSAAQTPQQPPHGVSAMPVAAASPTVDAIFASIDTDKNGSINAAEVKAMCGRARVSPLMLNTVTNTLMDHFDTDKNGSVSGAEFKGN